MNTVAIIIDGRLIVKTLSPTQIEVALEWSEYIGNEWEDGVENYVNWLYGSDASREIIYSIDIEGSFKAN